MVLADAAVGGDRSRDVASGQHITDIASGRHSGVEVSVGDHRRVPPGRVPAGDVSMSQHEDILAGTHAGIDVAFAENDSIAPRRHRPGKPRQSHRPRRTTTTHTRKAGRMECATGFASVSPLFHLNAYTLNRHQMRPRPLEID